jgi:hypothetical protein
MLPGKPATLERDINLAGKAVKMTMLGTKVDSSSYTVAYIMIQTDEAERTRLLAAMKEQMLRNIQTVSPTAQASPSTGSLPSTQASTPTSTPMSTPTSTPTSEQPITVPIIDDSGKATGSRSGIQVSAQGQVKQDKVQMQASFVADDQALYQLVALGPNLPDEETKQFLQSFRLIKR